MRHVLALITLYQLSDRLHATGCRDVQRGEVVRSDECMYAGDIQFVKGKLDGRTGTLCAVALSPVRATYNVAQSDGGFVLSHLLG